MAKKNPQGHSDRADCRYTSSNPDPVKQLAESTLITGDVLQARNVPPAVNSDEEWKRAK